MYKIRRSNCSTSSVLSGIESFSKRRTTTIGGSRGISSDLFVTFTQLYIEIPILPQHDSPPPFAIRTRFCGGRLRIYCAASLAIIRTRHLTLTTPQPLKPLLTLSCMMTLHRSLFPLTALSMCLSHPYQPYFVLTETPKTHRRSTTRSLFRCRFTLLIRPRLKAVTVPPLHRTQPPLVRHGEESTPLPDLCHLPSLKTSASLPPPAPTSPPSAVALEHNSYLRTYSDPPDFVSSPSPIPDLENILPTALSLSSGSPLPGPYHTASWQESHSSMPIAPTPGGAAPQRTSPCGLSNAAEGEGTEKAALRKDKVVLDSASVNRASSMAAPDISPQPPSVISHNSY